MKCLLLLAFLTDNGLTSALTEKAVASFTTIEACIYEGQAALIAAAPLVKGNVRRVEASCECRAAPVPDIEVLIWRAAR